MYSSQIEELHILEYCLNFLGDKDDIGRDAESGGIKCTSQEDHVTQDHIHLNVSDIQFTDKNQR